MINDEVNGIVKARPQDNLDPRYFAAAADDDSLITPRVPGSALKNVERFTEPGLVPVHGSDVVPRQIIHTETSTISDVRARMKAIRQEISYLRDERRLLLRSRWKDFMRVHRKVITRWRKVQIGNRLSPEVWRKVPTGTFRLVKQKVFLKPRPVVRRTKVFEKGSFSSRWHWSTQIVWVTPHVWRDLVLPVYRRVRIRGPIWRPVFKRVKTTAWGYDWPTIKTKYAAYRETVLRTFEKREAPLREALRRQEQILSSRLQQPHRMQSWTESGFIPPSWREFYSRYGNGESADHNYAYLPEFPSAGLFVGPGYTEVKQDPDESFGCLWFMPCLGDHSIQHTQPDVVRSWVRRFSVPYGVGNLKTGFTSKDVDHPATYVGSLKFLDTSTNQVDAQIERLRASELESLKFKGDYTFNLPRSIGELKDLKDTYTQGREFCLWLARGTRNRMSLGPSGKKAFDLMIKRTGSASKALCAAYLAWKFAIQPTIQDVETVMSQSSEWLTASRRRLLTTIETIRTLKSNILHLRRKFRADDCPLGGPRTELEEEYLNQNPVIIELSRVLEYDDPGLPGFAWGAGPKARAQLVGHTVTCGRFDDLCPVTASAGVRGSYAPQDDNRRLTVEPHKIGVLSRPLCDLDEIRYNLETGPYEYESTSQLPLHGRSYVSESKSDTDRFSNATWPKAEVQAYCRNHMSGVFFARYQISDLVDFMCLDQPLQEMIKLARLDERFASEWFDQLDSLYQHESGHHAAVKGLAAVDLIFVVWQLTPLSFIYDWLTTSDTIVTTLNNHLLTEAYDSPPSLEGIWFSKRCELLAGRPSLSIKSSSCTEYVSDWWGGTLSASVDFVDNGGTARHKSRSVIVATPKRVVQTARVEYAPDRKVRLARTGLYVAKRGEYISGGWETFLPQVRIQLNRSKVGTMLAMLVGFINPRK